MRIPLLGFSVCKTNNAFINEMTCSMSAKAWFIYKIKILLYFSELANNSMCPFISLLQCIL